MKVYVLVKAVEWENSSNWDVYDDEETAMKKANELNEEERDGSDVYYCVEEHILIKKADTAMSTK